MPVDLQRWSKMEMVTIETRWSMMVEAAQIVVVVVYEVVVSSGRGDRGRLLWIHPL